MTHLRKRMLEELQRRNYSENTTRCYIRTVEDFARRFNLPPDRLGPRQIREYQAELFQKRKLSPGTVATRLAALRFFYTKTLSTRPSRGRRMKPLSATRTLCVSWHARSRCAFLLCQTRLPAFFRLLFARVLLLPHGFLSHECLRCSLTQPRRSCTLHLPSIEFP